jgi:para-nitrobenzyl esterase
MSVAPVVETRFGSLRGVEEAGIRVFRGVPYANALHGARRFLPPEPPDPWKGVRDATRPGPSAPQFALPWFGWISAAGVSPGEDCLSLNIWTPGLDGARRPVLVWIHGGGFLVGSGSTPIYDGRDLARRGDAVVVSVNYRLGALGFVHLGSVFGQGFEQSTNLGVRDQIAALEWVRDHIDRFGGDPNNVTLFGQSAGAMSIGALLGAPRARRLFHRAVCQSGAADHVLEPHDAEEVALRFLDALGGPPPTLEALGRIPLRRILQAQRVAMNRVLDWRRMMVFLPAVDGDVIPEQPLAAVARGAAADIPLLIGTTLDEWKLFRLIDQGVRGLREEELVERFGGALHGYPDAPAPETAVREFRAAIGQRGVSPQPNEVWSAFQSARVMHVPASRLAAAQARGGGSAHAYLFTWRPPVMRRSLGACHALDIPFVFGSMQHPLARPLTGITGSAVRLSRKMQYAWIRFAREGSPGHDRLPDWPRYDAARRATMALGRRCALDDAPLEGERSLIDRWTRAPAEPPAEALAARAR